MISFVVERKVDVDQIEDWKREVRIVVTNRFSEEITHRLDGFKGFLQDLSSNDRIFGKQGINGNDERLFEVCGRTFRYEKRSP